MLRPGYLDRIPQAMVELYGQAEADILADMARRISSYNYYIPAAQHQHRKLQEMGMCHGQILRALSGLTGRASKELESLIEQAGAEALRADDAVYRQASLVPNPLSASPGIQEALRAGLRNTRGLFENLTRATANTASGQFERALDRAYMQVVTGAFDYNAAIRMAIKDLARQGVESVKYPSGRVDTIETAVRRAVVTGVNQAALRAQDARAKEMGCDLVEVTAHAGARPSHAVWQGGIYSRSGQDGRYPGLVEATGYGTGEGLGGWNCRHSMMPYFEGMPRAYTPEMLEGYNAKAVPYNGQMLTEYEASQRQRYIERKQRRWKREYKAMEAAGQDTGEAAAKLRQWRDAEKDFLRQTGFKRQGDRSQVAGFGKSEVGRIARVTSKSKSATITGRLKESAGNADVHTVGWIDVDVFHCVAEGIVTNEVIITNERIAHIRARHPNDFERYVAYLPTIIAAPDYILEANKPNTALVLKTVEEGGERFELILRLQTEEDTPGRKNSVITFLRVQEKRYARYLRTKRVLYKWE